MEYNFREIEAKWRKTWAENKTFKAKDVNLSETEGPVKPKYYVLDMFPYPSGAGLHVGHPLGYIASDIYARYKRLQGFNVLHPMGYDSFGLPAEQYAIQTGQHPEITTKTNVARYREQLDKIGFSFDWDREVRTSNPDYYKWTQWIFKQLFDCWYNNDTDRAQRIADLILIFEIEGNGKVNAVCDDTPVFSADEWNGYSEEEKRKILMNYRLTFLADSWVNWCPALGTVLANDEIKDGVSERGGHPVEQKLMRQWSMRITAYAERLLTGLDGLDWTDSIKDQQRNWIGKSVGASVQFDVDEHNEKIEVFTTRPDTIFGVSFMVLAPEHELVSKITTDECKEKVEAYVKQASLKSERDRQADVKNITGEFTGAYAIHPFTGDKIPVWIGDYVLASYGTGAVMSVPCGDQRDYDFAKHFEKEGLTIPNIFKNVDISESAYAEKDCVIANSDFLDGLSYKEAMKSAIEAIEERGFGKGKTNYRLRDAVFSRQRYWGEPFPVYYKGDTPYLIDDANLPVELPEVDKYLPTEDGEPPLARAKKEAWNQFEGDRMEYNTMPGWAGSSWYFLRYLDPKNENEFVAKDKVDYWQNVDLYIGGSEHATGHLLYSRFWTKFLYDLDLIPFDEPFKKMINQGMITGTSKMITVVNLVPKTKVLDASKIPFEYSPYKIVLSKKESRYDQKEMEKIYSEIFNNARRNFYKLNPEGIELEYISAIKNEEFRVDVNFVSGDIVDIDGLSNHPQFKFLKDELTHIVYDKDKKFYATSSNVIEKMSKSKFNVQTPDELVEKYGADTLRCYEMFLGPLEQSKPWDTKGISGVSNFLRKYWRLFHNEAGEFAVSDGNADDKAMKTLHKTIKKVQEDLNRFSFNTSVSNFMIAVNELTEQKCNSKHVLEQLTILMSSYAPHICEEIWEKLGHKPASISTAQFPKFEEKYLTENSFAYPVSFNGKMRFKLELPTNLSKEEIEKEVLTSEQSQKYIDGKELTKVIVVPNRIVNIVVKG